MRRDDVEEVAMRVLENLDQCVQTNRRYVLAAEAPNPISTLLRHALLQNYQCVFQPDFFTYLIFETQSAVQY